VEFRQFRAIVSRTNAKAGRGGSATGFNSINNTLLVVVMTAVVAVVMTMTRAEVDAEARPDVAIVVVPALAVAIAASVTPVAMAIAAPMNLGDGLVAGAHTLQRADSGRRRGTRRAYYQTSKTQRRNDRDYSPQRHGSFSFA
jgi:hypothetical protein